MNPHAVQIGLTATPRQLYPTDDAAEARADAAITADNHAYFGDPVYEYGIAQAMEDAIYGNSPAANPVTTYGAARICSSDRFKAWHT